MERITKSGRKYGPALYIAAAAIVILLLYVALASRGPAIPPQEFRQQDAGNVAGYMQDCVAGVLSGTGAIPESCRSPAAARAAYGVDVWFLLRAEHARAVDTAQSIVRGEILREKDFRACVKQGACVDLPLPRSGKDERQQQTIMRFLQSLAEGGEMDSQVCAFLDICRAMVKAGIYDPEPGEGK